MILDEMTSDVQIDFYTKPECCLCQAAFETLQTYRGEFSFNINRIDISNSPELLALYGNDIPVAVAGGRELFRHRIDPPELQRALRSLASARHQRAG